MKFHSHLTTLVRPIYPSFQAYNFIPTENLPLNIIQSIIRNKPTKYFFWSVPPISEYAYTLKVDEKSDVYSFGVVLLELLTGRRPVGNFGEEGVLDIVQWTKMQTHSCKERVVKILDERLGNVPIAEAMQAFFVALLCIQEQSVERPTMREVVQMLTQAKQPNALQMQ